MKIPKSKRGAYRQYNAAFRAYQRRFQGGGKWGWDWITLRINDPATYREMRYLLHIYPFLPE